MLENKKRAKPLTEEEPPPSDPLDPDWKGILKKSISSHEDLSSHFGIPIGELKEVCDKYPAMIPPYYLSLIKEAGDPIYKQCVPSLEEITDTFGEEDPLHEDTEHQTRINIPALITHRYPDRVLFRISNECAVYCRFCTRKRKVGDPTKQPNESEISQAVNYLKEHPEIRDVILSGGDPLLLSDSKLERIIDQVFQIVHPRKGIIRIGTRVPCVLPQRVTKSLCDLLKTYHPLYINTHFNHPAEITSESERACNLLADAGIPLGCQTVLLRGVNDNAAVMKELMQGLIYIRVRPYYIYQADPVKGTNHFRTPVNVGLEIYKQLRGHTSGLCVPTFVIDAPGGGGKIPLLPKYTGKINEGKILLRNYEGRLFTYPNECYTSSQS